MIIDLIVITALVIAIFKGYSRGLIVAVFSLLAFIIGLAAAMKLSVVAASYIGKAVNISDRWLPVISFAAVFIVVVFLVRWVAKIVEKTIDLAMLGWVNKIGGILVYVVLYLIIFSVIIFYAEQIKLLNTETVAASSTYPYIKPWGPKVIEGFGKIIPVFKDMFAGLQDFFGNMSEKIPPQAQ